LAIAAAVPVIPISPTPFSPSGTVAFVKHRIFGQRLTDTHDDRGPLRAHLGAGSIFRPALTGWTVNGGIRPCR
jgi:hypothetical protein